MEVKAGDLYGFIILPSGVGRGSKEKLKRTFWNETTVLPGPPVDG